MAVWSCLGRTEVVAAGCDQWVGYWWWLDVEGKLDVGRSGHSSGQLQGLSSPGSDDGGGSGPSSQVAVDGGSEGRNTVVAAVA